MVLELVVVVKRLQVRCVLFASPSPPEGGGIHARALTLKPIREQKNGVTLG